MKMYKAEKIGNITLICGDCMEVMRDMNANAYDLAICDPPYGIGANKMKMGTGSREVFRGNDNWDFAPPI